MTFGSLLNHTFRLMRDPGRDSYDLQLVKDHLNYAEKRYCAVTGFKQEKSTSISTVAGQEEYDLPSDFQSPIGFWRSSEKLGIIPRSKTIAFPNSGTPTAYFLEQKKFGLYPTPTASGDTITILYYGVGGSMSDDTDTPVIPDDHQMILVYYACLILSYESDDEKLGHFRDLLASEMGDAKEEILERLMPEFLQAGEESQPILDPRYYDLGQF